jgi:2-hydroxychromene-2-carboxylate isomerase
MNLKRLAMTQLFRRLWYLEYARKKQAAASAKRKAAGARRQVYYYHQVTMPHASLTAQVVEDLASAYDVELVQRLCRAPDAGMIAQHYEEKFYPFMRKDAADIASFYDLEFTDIGRQPSEELALQGSQLLAGVIDMPAFLTLAPKVNAAVWNEDEAELKALAEAHAPLDEAATCALMNKHETERLDFGYVYGVPSISKPSGISAQTG